MTDKTRSFFQRMAVIAVCIAVLSYTVFHMASLFSGEISTVVVRSSTEQTTVAFDGYLFRDETPVYAEYGGAVDYLVRDGLKLSAGQAYATVYEQGNNTSVSEGIDELDAKIALLERATASGYSLHDLPTINGNASDEYLNIVKKLADKNLRGISESIDAITCELDKVNVLTSDSSPVASTLEALYSARAALMAAGGNSIELKADKSGYFYSGVDGYEGIFTYDTAGELTPENYYDYVSAEPKAYDGGNVVGKMVYDSEWRFAAMVSKGYAEYFEEGVSYQAAFIQNEEIIIPITLERKTADSDGESFLMVFTSDRMPDNFDFSRGQSLRAVVSSVTGISVPKSATHRSGGNYYVYILKGSVVLERRIEIIHVGSDYYTVRDGVEPDGEDVFLQSNDNLIVDGNNLFDGRILE